MKKIELLAPVGNFECLKAAVQNGADAVYFGASNFNARSFANNFDSNELKHAIQYAKLRNVKTHLTLNILIQDNEYNEAISLAKTAYEYGIDAIIVQDLGLALKLIKLFPDLPIHASTQMTVHNLEGVLELEKLGFSRCVLSRELPLSEIEYIRNNCTIEIETFIHGALCICYSGQCLLSSIIGGRSGNRGKCAQPCRLSYKLLCNDKKIDSGYLLSTKDLCGLEYLPNLISIGTDCLKIEGRMKSPVYVATVTRIYRKYIDLAYSNKDYKIDNKDLKDLLQVFNRGGSSSGHLSDSPNNSLVFKDKPNNMGLFMGSIKNYNHNKGIIAIKLNESVSIGDSISIQNETGLYTISELMKDDQNIKTATSGEIVKIGRMKGNINVNDKVFKISSLALNNIAAQSYSSENKKIHLDCSITIKKDMPITLSINPIYSEDSIYNNLFINVQSDIIPQIAINKPIDSERIKKQINKTNNTPFIFDNIEVNLDDDLFIPQISSINELRRIGLQKLENIALDKINRPSPKIKLESPTIVNISNNSKIISVLFNNLNENMDYSLLSNKIDNIYIPFNYFINVKYQNILNYLCNNYNVYIYMPNIIRKKYMDTCISKLKNILEIFKIYGFVLSNIADFETLKDYKNNYDFIANYSLNISNSYSINAYKNLGITKIISNPELNKNTINALAKTSCLPIEVIVYGNIPLMTMNYCLLGKSNKCYSNCNKLCLKNNKYYLQDRKNLKFRVISNKAQNITTLYNSKILSIIPSEFNVSNFRIDILDETIEEINNITTKVYNNEEFNGYEYTSGNLNKNI